MGLIGKNLLEMLKIVGRPVQLFNLKCTKIESKIKKLNVRKRSDILKTH